MQLGRPKRSPFSMVMSVGIGHVHAHLDYEVAAKPGFRRGKNRP